MEDRLIELVRKYSLLYDSSCKEYTNQEARRNAWEEIGAQLGVKGNVCKERWTRLRNAYTNSLRRRRAKPGESPKNYPKWKLEDEMSFLGLAWGPRSVECCESDDEMICKTDDNSVQDTSGDISRFLDSKDSLITSTNEPPSSVKPPPSPSISYKIPAPINMRKTRKRRLVESAMGEMVNIMKENNRMQSQCVWMPPEAAQQNYANDETEMLFLSLARSVKKLSPEEQAKLKLEICSAVFQAEFHYAQCSKSVPYQTHSPYDD